MRRIGTIVLMLCGILGTSVFGYWEYDGTSVTVGGPGAGSGSDPYATWSWSAAASGGVTSGVTWARASGRAYGNTAIQLYTDYGLGLQRVASGHSEVRGTSSYHWVNDGTLDRKITATIQTTITSSEISYYGYSLDYLGTSPTTCSCDAFMEGGANTPVIGYYAYGLAHGVANSGGGSDAYNDWAGIEPTVNKAEGSQPSPSEGSCGGQLKIIGTASYGPYEDDPWGDSFTAMASVDGGASVQGRIVINDPEYYFGGFNAGAGYDISGNARFDLSGNIADRE